VLRRVACRVRRLGTSYRDRRPTPFEFSASGQFAARASPVGTKNPQDTYWSCTDSETGPGSQDRVHRFDWGNAPARGEAGASKPKFLWIFCSGFFMRIYFMESLKVAPEVTA
jgi:hypothetical protein